MMHKHFHRHDHPFNPPQLPPERPYEYQFILLHEDKPIGCIKGYQEDSGIDEVILYICGMKNTFHIESFISRREMKDFLDLVVSPIFKKTYFGAKIYMPGFDEGRQLFCVVQNVVSESLITSSLLTEYDSLEDMDDEDEILDIYPDIYEDENTEIDPEIKNDGSETTDDIQSEDEIENFEDGDGIQDVGGMDQDTEDIREDLDKDIHPNYIPIVNLCIEDDQYGVLLDIDITGFIDTQKPPHHHHHHKPKQEFDEDPEDDLIQDETESDGIDHVIEDMYL